MALLGYYRSLDEGQQYLVLGVVVAAVGTLAVLLAGGVFRGLETSTQITLGGIAVTGGLSFWSTRQIEGQFERYFSILRRGQLHLARVVDKVDGGATGTATDGGTHGGRTPVHGGKSDGNIDTDAAISGALTGSATFAMVALGLFGEYVAIGSLALFLVSAVGGVLGAYAGDKLVRWGIPTREPRPLPSVDPESIRVLVDQSDLDRRAVAALLLAAESEDERDEAS